MEDKRPTFIKKRDAFILAALLAAALLAFFLLPRRAGPVAVLTLGTGEAQTTRTLRLDKDARYNLGQADGLPFPVHLVVENGGIRFVESQCPDHLCEGFGTLRHEGDWAACLPAGTMLRVEEE